jgi:F-type H+-transporting ATPase subunit epsilon
VAETVRLEVVTPDREVLSIDTEEVVEVPGGDGLFGVLPGHTPLISTVEPGVIAYLTDPDTQASLVVGGGFAIVQDDVVTVLAEDAELPGEIDLEAAKAALAEAHAVLPGLSGDEERQVRGRIALNEGRIEVVARSR